MHEFMPLNEESARAYLGNMAVLAGIEQIEYQDGIARGLRAYRVHSGELEFDVLIDKCLDIGNLYFKGLPMNFLAQPGLMDSAFSREGENSARSVMGGMFFTCGLNNVGPLQKLENGQSLPQHGFIRNTPAFNHGCRTYWNEKQQYVLEIWGSMRESALFGSNYLLERKIRSVLGENQIEICDTITNDGGSGRIPLMLLYHFNTGYPLLDENAKLDAVFLSTLPRDEIAAAGMKKHDFRLAEVPQDQFPEQVFYHKIKAVNGRATCKLINTASHFGFQLSYDSKELPYLLQWKCCDKRNYVMGLEPANCFPEGLYGARNHDVLRYLEHGKSVETQLQFAFTHSECKK